MGIDPGLGCTGYGVVDARARYMELVEGGTIRPDSAQPLERRLMDLHDAASQVIRRLGPEAVVVEEVYSKYDHPRTAILMGHARGAILLAAAQNGVDVFSYAASRVKNALTGSGRASKEQVQKMITQLLSLASEPRPVDITDALALAACHASVSRQDDLMAASRRSPAPRA
jgi:crossover junction endodeoxyribonuclease RuvC